MRLIETQTGKFRWVERPEETKYAILSHVWAKSPDEPPEQTYQDVLAIQAQVKVDRAQNRNLPEDEVLLRLSPKIRKCCEQARKDGVELAWVDSCCIDKTSSSELTEAINSMYSWYATSAVCYAFLHDVPSFEDPHNPESAFRKSVWFTRGWTLQELIAPITVLFFSEDWVKIGGKHALSTVVEDVTGINVEILAHQCSVDSVSVARRMYWASRRVTTRKEDEAYSLMGIFGVNMPTIYGEGEGAFFRLQEEILKSVPDQSIFAWDLERIHPTAESMASARLLLAPSPKAFSRSASIMSVTASASYLLPGITALPVWSTTPHGIRTSLLYYPLNDFIHDSRRDHERTPVTPNPAPSAPVHSDLYLIPLACQDGDEHIIALVLKNRTFDSSGERPFSVEPVHMELEDSRLSPSGLGLSDLPYGLSNAPGEPEQLVCRILCLQWRQLRCPSNVSEFYIAHRPSLLLRNTTPSHRIYAVRGSERAKEAYFLVGTNGPTIPDLKARPRRRFQLIRTHMVLSPFQVHGVSRPSSHAKSYLCVFLYW